MDSKMRLDCSLHDLESESQNTESQNQSWIATDPGNARIWSYKSTIAFWASLYFVAGSILFIIGSVGMIPGFCPRGEAHETYARVWVEHPFMVGAWCFTLGNYLSYFQVINKLNGHGAASSPQGQPGDKRLRFIAVPTSDLGHLASLANCIGALCYNVNTMGMFSTTKFGMGHNLGYATTGVVGSLFFVMGAILEGEYNGWRKISSPETLRNSAVWMSYFGFAGGLFFFIGYAFDYNHFADQTEAITMWGVAVPFTIGSVFFLIASWMAQFLWKTHVFGIGFAKELTVTADAADVTWKVDWAQQFMIVIYCLNLCIAWWDFGEFVGEPVNWSPENLERSWDTLLRILGYTCILGLASGVHVTPTEHPYVFLFWLMRFTALADFVGQLVLIHARNPLLFT